MHFEPAQWYFFAILSGITIIAANLSTAKRPPLQGVSLDRWWSPPTCPMAEFAGKGVDLSSFFLRLFLVRPDEVRCSSFSAFVRLFAMRCARPMLFWPNASRKP
jgi:hypothetical protein